MARNKYPEETVERILDAMRSWGENYKAQNAPPEAGV